MLFLHYGHAQMYLYNVIIMQGLQTKKKQPFN
jgi:hypothetical protein